MPAIRSAAEIAEKWSRVTPGRSSDYQAGIAKPKVDWEAATKGAAGAYEAGVAAAIADKRFARGVTKAGTRRWQEKATVVGVGRWGPGVAAAVADYESGFAPFRDVIEKTVLPPRRMAGDPANIDRVRALATALNTAKIKGA